MRIATGSCAYLNDFKFDRPGKPYGDGEEIFDSIAATEPDLMLWLGDNIYLRDTEHTSRDGHQPPLPLLPPARAAAEAVDAPRRTWRSGTTTTSGPTTATSRIPTRGWTTEAFLRYWPMPYAPPADGLYGKILQGDVDIFMLDDRTQRYPERWPEGA